MMEILDILLHLQDHLHAFTQQYGTLVYALLFLIVFCETGLVVTPFLPGDSLLFAVGAIAADPASGLDPWIAAVVLLVAAILGDTVNYWIGPASSNKAISTKHRISSAATEARPSSSPVSFPLSAPSPPLSPARARWITSVS